MGDELQSDTSMVSTIPWIYLKDLMNFSFRYPFIEVLENPNVISSIVAMAVIIDVVIVCNTKVGNLQFLVCFLILSGALVGVIPTMSSRFLEGAHSVIEGIVRNIGDVGYIRLTDVQLWLGTILDGFYFTRVDK